MLDTHSGRVATQRIQPSKPVRSGIRTWLWPISANKSHKLSPFRRAEGTGQRHASTCTFCGYPGIALDIRRAHRKGTLQLFGRNSQTRTRNLSTRTPGPPPPHPKGRYLSRQRQPHALQTVCNTTGIPHGGLRAFRGKSIFPKAIGFQARNETNLVTSHPRIWVDGTLVVHRVD